jgi:TolB-like protein
MDEPQARLYEFGGFRLDLQQHLLLSNRDGQPISLPARVFETLLYLVEHRGELLDKSTLMKAVWPNVVVEENSLNQNISTLRRVLGENPGEHRFIVTVPGRGYRFVASVKLIAPSAESAAPRGTSSTPAVAGDRTSIAVLPFANLTGDSAKDYMADGMAEELIHMLARVPGLKVPARTSSFAYRGRNTDVRDIARDLSVGSVLEGSVRSAGERIRITAQLIDGHTGFHVWSHSFDRRFEDLFELQDELARAVLRALNVSVDEAPAKIAVALPPTRDLEAYQLYLQGWALTFVPTMANMLRAVELLQQALLRDPQFARAHAALAFVRTTAVEFDYPMPNAIALAENEASHALAIDPGIAVARLVLGFVHAARGEWRSAEEDMHVAIGLDPRDPVTYLIHAIDVAQTVGHLRHARDESWQAYTLAPSEPVYLAILAASETMLGLDEEARRNAELAFTLGFPRTVTPMPDTMASLEFGAGRYDEAAECIAGSLTLEARSATDEGFQRLLWSAFADPTRRVSAFKALQNFRRKLPQNALDAVMRKRLIVWFAMLGEFDAAFAAAHDTLDHYARSGVVGTAWGALWIPALREFRRDPRFQALAARMRLFDYWDQYGPPDGCELRDGVLICH